MPISDVTSAKTLEDQIRLGINRNRGEGEVELVRLCYGCSKSEARRILSVRLSKEKLAMVRGMVDAILLERRIANGYEVQRPDWLLKMRTK